MKYYIGSINGSGIEAETFEDFVEYLRDMARAAEEQGDGWFEVNVENYIEGNWKYFQNYAWLYKTKWLYCNYSK